ncbi:MAG: serine hydrolase domain-containing protein [Sphingobium sp.]
MVPTPPLSPERFAAVEAHVRALVADGTLPHAHFLGVRDGEVVSEFCTGEAREDGRPLRTDAIYRIASMTKAVTAVLFMMLVEDGRVALDDPVADVLPELADLAVYGGGAFPPFATRPAAAQPTMIDLLRHVGGFTYGFQQHSPVDQAYWLKGIHNFKAVITRDGVLGDLARLPLLHEPGERFTYSFGIDLIGIVCERLTGRSLGDLFADRIFAPLGMEDTGFTLRPQDADRFTNAWAMHPRRGRYLYDAADDSIWLRPSAFESGGGGLLSTMADYRRFCATLIGEGEALLRPETVAAMTRNHLPGGGSIGEMSRSKFGGEPYLHTGHGLGVAVSLPGGARPAGEFHWSGLFSTWFSVVPSERMILILMTQIMPLQEDVLPFTIHRMLFGD